ncbi:MAG: hypothetical protein ACLFQV_07140 [Vulcanimicrobiota bacterium]
MKKHTLLSIRRINRIRKLDRPGRSLAEGLADPFEKFKVYYTDFDYCFEEKPVSYKPRPTLHRCLAG